MADAAARQLQYEYKAVSSSSWAAFENTSGNTPDMQDFFLTLISFIFNISITFSYTLQVHPQVIFERNPAIPSGFVNVLSSCACKLLSV